MTSPRIESSVSTNLFPPVCASSLMIIKLLGFSTLDGNLFFFIYFFQNEFQIKCHLAMRKTLKLNKKRNFYSINHLYQFPCYGTKKSMQNEKKIVSVMWWVARQAREKKVFLMAMTGKCREIKIMMTLAQFFQISIAFILRQKN